MARTFIPAAGHDLFLVKHRSPLPRELLDGGARECASCREVAVASGLGLAVEEGSMPILGECQEICRALDLDPLGHGQLRRCGQRHALGEAPAACGQSDDRCLYDCVVRAGRVHTGNVVPLIFHRLPRFGWCGQSGNRLQIARRAHSCYS